MLFIIDYSLEPDTVFYDSILATYQVALPDYPVLKSHLKNEDKITYFILPVEYKMSQ